MPDIQREAPKIKYCSGPEAAPAEPKATAPEPANVPAATVTVLSGPAAFPGESATVAAEPATVAAEPATTDAEPAAVLAEPATTRAEPDIQAIQCRVLRVTTPFMRGPDVLAVQQSLVARGFHPGQVDGIYGPRTESAVKAFETAHGILATGIVCGGLYQMLGIDCVSIPPCPGAITCRILQVTSPFLSGADVTAVQRALIARGFHPGAVDGIYGPMTASAVRRFQSANRLPVTGVVCGQTYVLLGVSCQTVPPCPSGPTQCRVLVTSNPFMSGSDVRAVQQALQAQGFSPGEIDGIYGPLTASAVRRFQAARGVLVTGVVCDGLYSTLGITCPSVPPCPVLPPIATCRRLAVTTPFISGSDVAAVQNVLANRGFDPGAVDGIYGPNTVSAVSGFQAAAGLPITGIVCTTEYRALLINCTSFPSCS